MSHTVDLLRCYDTFLYLVLSQMYLYREQKHASALLYRLLDENMGNKWRYILNVAKNYVQEKWLDHDYELSDQRDKEIIW